MLTLNFLLVVDLNLIWWYLVKVNKKKILSIARR